MTWKKYFLSPPISQQKKKHETAIKTSDFQKDYCFFGFRFFFQFYDSKILKKKFDANSIYWEKRQKKKIVFHKIKKNLIESSE